MTCRPSTIAALLVVSAILAAQSATAAPRTIGDPGTLDGMTGGPVRLPDGGRTLPSPAAPADRNTLLHAPDRASLYKAYATVSRTPDGTTTIIPASPRLRAVIDEEFGTDLSL